MVELYDETEKTGKFQIFVTRKGFESDNDRISLAQISESVDVIINYLKENIKIQLKQDGTIDFISLVHNYMLFSQKNLKRVKEASIARQKSLEKGEDSIVKADEGSRTKITLTEDRFEQFIIERNNHEYRVRV